MITDHAIWTCVVVHVLVGCANSPVDCGMDASVGCADEYVSATIEAPDHNIIETCARLDAEQHLSIRFRDPDCQLAASGARTMTGSAPYFGFGAGDDWFAHAATAESFSFLYTAYDVQGCGDRDFGFNCTYTSSDCVVRVTRPAHTIGEYVEAELAEPCALTGNDGQTTPYPTIRSLRFRALTTATPHQIWGAPDGSLCTYPYDAGLPSP